VENAIAAHPKVAAVAVVGVPDSLLGERVKAFVTHCPAEGEEVRKPSSWPRSWANFSLF
jgi:acyl-coenzyme A synthetase/AMP-(fatty) acid ligase